MSVDFTAWLNNPDVERVCLVDLQAYVDGTGVVNFYVSSQPYASSTLLYDARLISSPTFTVSVPEAFYGRSVAGFGDIVIDNSDGELDGWINYGWDGRTATIKLGDPSWDIADFQTVMVATVEDLVIQSDSELKLNLFDKTKLLNKEIQSNLMVSPSTDEDKPVPLAFGVCYNITPRIKDPSNLIYKCHDGALSSIDAVYDNGVQLTAGVGYTANASSGEFTLTSSPAGTITADVTGSNTTPSTIINDIISTYGGLASGDIDSATFTAFASACAYTIGLYVRDRANIIDLLDLVSQSCGGYWYFNRSGKFSLYRFTGVGTSSLSINEDKSYGDIEVEILGSPNYAMTLGYEKNWTVQNGDGLAGAVTLSRRGWLENEYRSVTDTDSSVLTKHLTAKNPEMIETLISNSTDAGTEVTRVLTLNKTQRFRISVKTFGNALSLVVGDTITISDSRFGMSAGVDCVIIGLTEYYADGKVDLELWR